MQYNNQDEKKKHNYNKPQLKTVYPFIRGIPPASNWSNHFTSLLFPGGKYLIYISNSFIIVLDLINKKFCQILSSYKISPKEKPNILLLLNNKKFLSIINSGDIVVFECNNGDFIEDLKANKLNKVCQNTKCGVFDNEKNIMILSNEEKIICYSIQYNGNYNIQKIYEINNINEIEYFITEMILIKNDSNNYLAVSNNIGNIIIYQYNIVNYQQILLINNSKKENIYNIIYDKSTNSLFSINKSGTLNIYQLITKEENKLDYNTITNLTNKFNDQSITEIYLYFSISFICLNDSTYILVSSNKGRIFLYNIKNNEFKEIAENPHKNSIYSIIFNSSMNQIIFFSSDYKISIFNIKYLDNNEPSLNFLSCINTLPSKVKLLKQCYNKIYFLYQIQNQLFINYYDIKKEKNTIDSLQNKVKIKHINDLSNNINNENNSINFNLSLCKLINEETILLINKKNEIIIYNIENEEIEYNFLFLSNEDLIIDILYEDNILYILYMSGKIIIYNTNTKKIEKYTISNLIEKGNILHLKNNIILIGIKEHKSEIVQFYILKNYIYIKLKEIYIFGEFFSFQYLLQNYNFFYFYTLDNELKIYYMNMAKQYEIIKDIDIKTIKYESYLDILNKLKNSITFINEKYYGFYSLFHRSDVKQNILKITNIAINEKFNMICSFSDGSIMYYVLDIDENNPNNYIINKIIYKYLIKVSFLSVNDAIFINNINNDEKNSNNFLFATTSSEQSLKITNPTDCNILNIHFQPNLKINSNNINTSLGLNNNYIINKSFTNLFSNYFFTQSTKEAKIFSDNFSVPEDINSSSIEVLLYSYFENNKEKNMDSVKIIIEYAIKKNKNKKENSKYIEEVSNFFTQKEQTDNKLIFGVEKDLNIIMDSLINYNCYVECLLFIKYKNLGLNTFIQTLERIKKSIYIKQLFQATKIEKIIQYYKNKFNIV